MATKQEIEARLAGAFPSSRLDVVDESDLHRGHAGWREGGGTHFRVGVVSGQFEGLSRIERHRLVHQALADELAESVHALSLDLRTPEEVNRQAPASTAQGH